MCTKNTERFDAILKIWNILQSIRSQPYLLDFMTQNLFAVMRYQISVPRNVVVRFEWFIIPRSPSYVVIDAPRLGTNCCSLDSDRLKNLSNVFPSEPRTRISVSQRSYVNRRESVVSAARLQARGCEEQIFYVIIVPSLSKSSSFRVKVLHALSYHFFFYKPRVYLYFLPRLSKL